MGVLLACNLLNDVAYSLISPTLVTILGTAVTPGGRTVTPGSMLSIYSGAQLVVGSGASLETVTVSALTSTTFTATFANSHAATDVLQGPTFPEGQPDHILFSQSEMLAYLVDAQKDFLLKTRLVYSVLTETLVPGQYYDQPAQAIRLERIAINGNALLNDSQSALDLLTSTWNNNQAPAIPLIWFQDQIDTARFGFSPPYQAGGPVELWFSDRGPDSLQMHSGLTVPDCFAYSLKYGVLQRAWSKDGEQRSPERAEYCRKRYDLVVMLAVRFMFGVQAALLKQEEESQKFSPMAVPA